MLLKKMVSESDFSDNQFSNGIFPSPRSYLAASHNKKGQSKSTFHRPVTRRRLHVELYWRVGLMYTQSAVCVCVCVFIKLHITAQSSLVILVILCHSR